MQGRLVHGSVPDSAVHDIHDMHGMPWRQRAALLSQSQSVFDSPNGRRMYWSGQSTPKRLAAPFGLCSVAK